MLDIGNNTFDVTAVYFSNFQWILEISPSTKKFCHITVLLLSLD